LSRSFETGAAPHFPAPTSVASMMRQVLLALLPGIATWVYFFGPGVLVQIGLAVGFALLFEALMLRLRGKSVGLFLGDWSAVLTAVLLALCIPPLAPWWIAATALLAAIVIAKHLYGGLGNNLFNPAMVGYVVVLISFPREMTQWPTPLALADGGQDLGLALTAIFTGQLPASGPVPGPVSEPGSALAWDAITSATPLDALKTGVEQGLAPDSIRTAPVFGAVGGFGWEWIAAAYVLGGLWLLARRVIRWHVPVATLGTALVLSLVSHLLAPEQFAPPLLQVLSGGLVLGAFFIATDPVSGCASPRGRLLFGAGVAILTLVIRYWGGYPDGVAFAVLLMNMAAPMIDRYTRPRIYGR
jgi:electron transport complex protein RnfD